MRCSSFSALFDEYIEGSLTSANRAAVEAHVEGCAECERLLTELRVVDALLLSPRQVELAPNFTFRVMAELNFFQSPRTHRTPRVKVIATYLAFAWVAIASWFGFAPASARDSIAFLRDVGFQFIAAGAAVSAMLSQTLGHSVLNVTTSVSAILALDLFATATAASAYVWLRRRFPASVVVTPEVG